jgi:hypothetical protein
MGLCLGVAANGRKLKRRAATGAFPVWDSASGWGTTGTSDASGETGLVDPDEGSGSVSDGTVVEAGGELAGSGEDCFRSDSDLATGRTFLVAGPEK